MIPLGPLPKDIVLSKEWESHEIDLSGLDFSSVIGGFCWVSDKSCTIYLDEIRFE